jgi:RND family efflux transporter MFP subunit
VKLSAKVFLPIAVLGVAVAVTLGMISARPTTESERPPNPVPLVEVVQVLPRSVSLRVDAQGSVEPRTESDLVAEVAGRIVWSSPQLASGGFFDEGDELVRIDPRDYEVALEGAKAVLARAQSSLVHTTATLERQQSMREQGISSQARLDEALHARATATASVREAKVTVRRAELDLDRTRIRAPFAGRVREKHVGMGQFVSRGVPIARVYSVDYAEVRLPIRDADLAYLDLPAAFPAEDPAADAPGEATTLDTGAQVILSAQVAGEPRTWKGRIVRTEGARDARTRMLNVVARVEDPYARGASPGHEPLPIGIFVDASIQGRRVDGVFEVPRTALRRNDEVMVIDDNNLLRVRPVDVLRADREQAWIRSGLAAGERVVISPADFATEGMEVRALEAAAPAHDTAGDTPEETPAS